MKVNINYKVLYENSIVEINILEDKITLLNEHLKKYTSPDRNICRIIIFQKTYRQIKNNKMFFFKYSKN